MRTPWIILVLTINLALFGQQIENLDEGHEITGYEYSFQSDPTAPYIDGVSWTPIELPATLEQDGAGCLWVRTEITFSSFLQSVPIVLDAGKFKGSMEIWVDGQLILLSGTGGDHFSFPKYIRRTFQLPSDSIRYNRPVTVAIRFYNPTGGYPDLTPWSVHNYNLVHAEVQFSDFLNAGMYQAFSLLSFFIALYFLLQYLYSRKNYATLWFGLANIALGTYFIEMGLTFSIGPPILSFVLAKSMLTLFFLFLPLFIIDYFKVFQYKWLRWTIVGVQGLFVLLFVIFGRGYIPTQTVFTFSLIPGGIWLILCLVGSIMSARKGNKDAIIVSIGIGFGLIAALYDFSFTFMGSEPFFWLQGPGIVIFDTSIFITLAIRAIKNHQSLTRYTTEMEEQKEGLSALLGEVARISSSMAGISVQLDSSIGHTKENMQSLSSSSNEIAAQLREQEKRMDQSGDHVNQLLEASDGVYQSLEQQSQEIQGISSVIEQMLGAVNGLTSSLQHISQSGNSLEQLARQGEEAMGASNTSIKEIKEVSSKVYQVVDAMNDLADRTNLLSMNASIEAAHAGNSGRGFAVVAQEIKKLAEGSSQRAGEVISEINLIQEKIAEGVENNQKVDTALKDITGETRKTVKDIQDIYQAMEDQRKASQEINSSLDTLNQGRQRLHRETDRQHVMSQHLDQSMSELVASSKEMNLGLEDVFRNIQELVSAAEEISGLSNQAMEEAQSLESMTD